MKIHIKYKKRLSLLGVLWFSAGVLLLAAAVLSFSTNRSELLAISPLLGAAMLLSGLVDILTYVLRRDVVKSVDWILANGLTSTLLSLYLLFNQFKTVELILLFFGLWELFSGILKAVDTIELRRDRLKGWQLFALVAAIKTLSGAASLMKPVDESIEPNVLIGVIILIQAVVFLIKIAVFPHLIKVNPGVRQVHPEDIKLRVADD